MNRFKLIGVLCALSGCGNPPQDATSPTAEIAELLVVPTAVVLHAGEEGMVQAQANDASGEPIGGATFTFASANPAVEVTDQGIVRSLGRAVSDTHLVVKSGRLEKRIRLSVQPGTLHQLERVAGENQSVPAGEALTEPLALRAVDRYGNALEGIELEARMGAGAPPMRSHTDDQGIARLTLTAPERAGEAAIQISAAGNQTVSISLSLEVVPNRPSSIELLEQPASAATAAGTERPLELRVSDRFGNAVPEIDLQVAIDGRPVESTFTTDSKGIGIVTVPAVSSARARMLTVQTTSDPVVSTQLALPTPGAQRNPQTRP